MALKSQGNSYLKLFLDLARQVHQTNKSLINHRFIHKQAKSSLGVHHHHHSEHGNKTLVRTSCRIQMTDSHLPSSTVYLHCSEIQPPRGCRFEPRTGQFFFFFFLLNSILGKWRDYPGFKRRDFMRAHLTKWIQVRSFENSTLKIALRWRSEGYGMITIRYLITKR